MTDSTSTYTIGNIDLSDIDYSMTLDTSALSGGFNGITYADISNSYNTGVTIQKGNLQLNEDADIKIGERSLIKTLDTISERLAILETNSKLEAEFAELRDLGNQYRQLEQELKERMVTWELLKKEHE